MKKLLTFIISVTIMASQLCPNIVRAEELEISDFAGLVSFMSGEAAKATVTASFECTSSITVSKDKTLYLEDDVVITAPSNAARMFSVDSGKTLKIIGSGENKTGIIAGPKNTSSVQKSGTFAYAEESTLELKNLTIRNFSCPKDSNISGTICVYEGFLKIDGVNFLNNSVTEFGGAIAATGEAEINNSYFEGNASTYENGCYGGAIDFEYGTLTLKGTTFKNNTSKYGSAGAVNLLYAEATIEDCSFENCKAYEGSAINCTDSQTYISGSTFKGNISFEGGTLFAYGGETCIETTTFTENSARYAPAIISQEGTVVIGDGTSITDNVLGQYSAIELWKNGNLVFDGTDIALNNFHEDGNKDDVFVFGVGYCYVKKDATFEYPIALSAEDIDAKTTIKAALKDGYEGNLKGLFVSGRGNMNLTETDEGLFITAYGISDEPDFDNRYTVTVDDVRGTDIKVSYQWYSQKIMNAEKLGNKGNYTLFESLELDSTVSYSNGTYTYDSDYHSRFMTLKGLKKGQVLQFDIKAQNENPTTTMIWLIDENEKVYSEYGGDGSPNTYRAVIPHDGDYVVNACIGTYVGYDFMAIVSDVYIFEYESEIKIGDHDNVLDVGSAKEETFCRVTFTNGNAVTSFDSSYNSFGTPLEGNDQRILAGHSEALAFSLEATDSQYDDFVENGAVYLDGMDDDNLLESGKDYTFSKGSINIVLCSDLVSGLSTGKHYVYVLEHTEDDLGPVERLTAIALTIYEKTPVTYVVVNTETK